MARTLVKTIDIDAIESSIAANAADILVNAAAIGANASDIAALDSFINAFNSRNLDGSGYQNFPGGMKLVWNTFTSNTDNNQVVTFPHSFLNGTVRVAVTGSGRVVATSSGNFTYDRFNEVDGSPAGLNYIAVGRWQ